MIHIGNSNVKYAEIALVKIDKDGNRLPAGIYRWHRNPLMRLWFDIEDRAAAARDWLRRIFHRNTQEN